MGWAERGRAKSVEAESGQSETGFVKDQPPVNSLRSSQQWLYVPFGAVYLFSSCSSYRFLKRLCIPKGQSFASEKPFVEVPIHQSQAADLLSKETRTRLISLSASLSPAHDIAGILRLANSSVFMALAQSFMFSGQTSTR